MEKAKVIIKKMNAGLVKSCKKCGDINVLSRVVLCIAVFMVVVAAGVICFYKPARDAVFSTETHTIVEVKSGDTLSKILGNNGFSMRDIDTISKNLKKDAGNAKKLKLHAIHVLHTRKAKSPVAAVSIFLPWMLVYPKE